MTFARFSVIRHVFSMEDKGTLITFQAFVQRDCIQNVISTLATI